ncbi:hypothetical protein Tco_0651245 [Tanacetum coccineum]
MMVTIRPPPDPDPSKAWRAFHHDSLLELVFIYFSSHGSRLTSITEKMSPGTEGLVFLLISVLLAICAQYSIASVTLDEANERQYFIAENGKEIAENGRERKRSEAFVMHLRIRNMGIHNRDGACFVLWL